MISNNTQSFLNLYIEKIVNGDYDDLETASNKPTFPKALKHINSGNKDLDIYTKRNITERIVMEAWRKFEPTWFIYLPEDPRKYWEKFLEEELR